jgi:hypothetical protein
VATLADILGVMGGMALGGLVGYQLGVRVRERRRAFWLLAGASVAVGLAVDLAGLATGRRWLAVGGLGLMFGLLTGLKYGGIAGVRIWDPSSAPAPPPAEEAPDQDPRDSRSEPRAPRAHNDPATPEGDRVE